MNADPIPPYFTDEFARLAHSLNPRVTLVKHLHAITLSPRRCLEYKHRIAVGYVPSYKPLKTVVVLEDEFVPDDMMVLHYRDNRGRKALRIVKVESTDALEATRELVAV